jgi:hypothetical protein
MHSFCSRRARSATPAGATSSARTCARSTFRCRRPPDGRGSAPTAGSFNVLNRANFGAPSLTAFAGTTDSERPFATFGRITSTVTSARQIQLGARVVF